METTSRATSPSREKSARLTMAFAMTALIFYIPANIFPFMTIEMYGHRNSSTIWQGIVSLAQDGSWLIALVIFLASILIPFLKIIILFYLSLVAKKTTDPSFNIKLHQFVEAIGRWSMLDIFLLAVLVAVVKLGKLTTVTAEPGAVMFLFVVIFTMLASAYFDPQFLESENDENLR
ncbi:MAG: paraquat-inducible protein A [Bdellovibrionota bacterium]